jgi:hypothetical protein
MNEKQFLYFWNNSYPESYPIGHELKWIYNSRWFRIHSLPESKRYANTAEEYEIIFSRQNEIIDEVIGPGEDIIVLFGMYVGDDIINRNYNQISDFEKFNPVLRLELHKLRPEEYDEEIIYDVFIKNDKWQSGKMNKLLKAIADDEIRAIILSTNKKSIIIPYDGGLDVIAESSEMRDALKLKYKEWLSTTEDGM